MPVRLRPTAPTAADAILVGDPGRALLLAQELLEQPKMSNHARGLWGYSGVTAAGHELTIQSTGMGGPSAAVVLGDLVELGVRRAVRVGSCSASAALAVGSVALVGDAIATGGSAMAFGLAVGEVVAPDPELTDALRAALGPRPVEITVASFDLAPTPPDWSGGFEAADMQTVALLARGGALGLAVAALLVVVEAGGLAVGEDREDAAVRKAGTAAAAALSNPKVEG